MRRRVWRTRDYKLYPRVIADLEDIYLAGLAQFGLRQADLYQRELHGRFQRLAKFPDMAGTSAKR